MLVYLSFKNVIKLLTKNKIKIRLIGCLHGIDIESESNMSTTQSQARKLTVAYGKLDEDDETSEKLSISTLGNTYG